MLYKNAIFLKDGQRFRMLHADEKSRKTWIVNLDSRQLQTSSISLEEAHALVPMMVGDGNGSQLEGISGDPTATGCAASEILVPIEPTASMIRVRDEAERLLGDLPKKVPDIFDPAKRGALVQRRAAEVPCSPTTLYKHLQRYLKGGQTANALLGQFHLTGRRAASKAIQVSTSSRRKVTVRAIASGKRGANPKSGVSKYQISENDCRHMTEAIENVYLKDKRATIAGAFQAMLEQHFTYTDGNGKKFLQPPGLHPTLKQFTYFLEQNYTFEAIARRRKGSKKFERDMRQLLTNVLEKCNGVGHIYEGDGSIVDVYLVSDDDIREIVGKASVYFIVDRKSRLIVGWYIGLENLSFVCVMQAMFNIAQSKQEICERLGIPYDPTDWPAHGIYPEELLHDRGEGLVYASDRITKNLGTTVANLATQRPDLKAVCESKFFQLRTTLQRKVPGMDPPENAKQRQNENYVSEACLTVDQLEAIVVAFIIRHNRSPNVNYPLSLKEIAESVMPSPIELFNHGLQTRSGNLSRMTEAEVRLALLPRAEASVTPFGISHLGCNYTCDLAEREGWFVRARQQRFQVNVTFDSRLVDSIYVHYKGSLLRCTLTGDSKKFEGKSFPAVDAIRKLQAIQRPDFEHEGKQQEFNFALNIEPHIKSAEKKLKAAGKLTRNARKVDTAEKRKEVLAKERQRSANADISTPELLGIDLAMRTEGPTFTPADAAVATPTRKGEAEISPSPAAPVKPTAPVAELTIEQRLAALSQRISHVQPI